MSVNKSPADRGGAPSRKGVTTTAPSITVAHRCEGWTGAGEAQCSRMGKVQRGKKGTWFCGIHDPEKRQRRREKERAKREVEWGFERLIKLRDVAHSAIGEMAISWSRGESTEHDIRNAIGRYFEQCKKLAQFKAKHPEFDR